MNHTTMAARKRGKTIKYRERKERRGSAFHQTTTDNNKQTTTKMVQRQQAAIKDEEGNPSSNHQTNINSKLLLPNIIPPSSPPPSLELVESTICCQVEKLFIQRQYTKALSICNKYFTTYRTGHTTTRTTTTTKTNDNNETSYGGSTVISLSNPLQHVIEGKSYSISILSSSTNDNDHILLLNNEQQQQRIKKRQWLSSIIAIALQSWYELDQLDCNRTNRQQEEEQSNNNNNNNTNNNKKKNWKYLQPLLEYLNHYPIPTLELFVIWIYFWENQQQQNKQQQSSAGGEEEDYQLKAIDWTIQVLLQIPSPLENDDLKSCNENVASYQELWIHCLTEQLPKISITILDDDDDITSPSNNESKVVSIKRKMKINKKMKLFSSLIRRLVESLCDGKCFDTSATTSMIHSILFYYDKEEGKDNNINRAAAAVRRRPNNTLHYCKKKKNLETIIKIEEILRKSWQTCHKTKCCELMAIAIQKLEEEKQQQLLIVKEEQQKRMKEKETMVASMESNTVTTLIPSSQHYDGYHYYNYNIYYGRIKVWVQYQYQRLLRLLQIMSKEGVVIDDGEAAATTTLYNNNNNNNSLLSHQQHHHRYEIGISIFMVLLTIRYRLRISKAFKSVLLSLLSPITELVQALVITTSEDDETKKHTKQ